METPESCRKMNRNCLWCIGQPQSEKEKQMWIKVLKDLPAGSNVGILDYRKEIGIKVTEGESFVKIKIGSRQEDVPFEKAICEELWCHRVIARLLENESICDLPF
jgi:hypothetical protein